MSRPVGRPRATTSNFSKLLDGEYIEEGVKSWDDELVASELGVSRRCISDWRNNPSKIRVHHIIKLSKIMGIDSLFLYSEIVKGENYGIEKK